MGRCKKKQPWDWFPEIRVYACGTLGKAKKLARKHAKCEFHDTGKDATADIYQSGTDVLAVVLVKDFDGSADKMALLAHECVHVVGAFLDGLGEVSNDSEFRAYETQAVMLACLDQLGYGKSDG